MKIDKLTEPELVDLNHGIVARLRFLTKLIDEREADVWTRRLSGC